MAVQNNKKDVPPVKKVVEPLVNLEKFKLLLNTTTMTVKLNQVPALPERDPDWIQAGKALTAVLEEAKSTLVDTALSGVIHYNEKRNSTLVKIKERVLIHEPLQHAEAFIKGLASISEEQINQVAQVLSGYYVQEFSRNGVAHLAYPFLGRGLKAAARKKDAPKELFSWTNSWAKNSTYIFPEDNKFSDNGHYRERGNEYFKKEKEALSISPEEVAAIESLEEFWRIDPIRAHYTSTIQKSDELEDPRSGVHLSGGFTSSASKETALELLNSKSETQLASRRLAAFAISRILGDQFSNETACLRHVAPSLGAEESLCLECSSSGTVNNAKVERGYTASLIKRAHLPISSGRASRPSLCIIQAAQSIENESMRRGAYGVSPIYADSKSELTAHLKKAHQILNPLHELSDKIAKKALSYALVRQEMWLKENDLLNALNDANLLTNNKASLKMINWLVFNPKAAEAARQASQDPDLALAADSARYFGIIVEDAEGLKERAYESWEALGLSRKNYSVVSKSEAARVPLKNLMHQIVAGAKGKRSENVKRLGLYATSLNAALNEAPSLSKALSFAEWTAQKASDFIWTQEEDDHFSGSPHKLDKKIKTIQVGNREQAEKVLKVAAAKEAQYHNAIQALFQYKQALSVDKKTEKKHLSAEAALSLLVCKGTRAPSIQWERVDFTVQSFEDVALRRSISLAKALKEAESSGVHGEIAIKTHLALGITEALNGNDLIAQTKAALQTHAGLSASGWKALAQYPKALTDAFIIEWTEHCRDSLADIAREAGGRVARNKAEIQQDEGVNLVRWLLSESAKIGMSGEDCAIIQKMNTHNSLLLTPFIKKLSVSDVESAQFACVETTAKEKRFPALLKSLVEEYKKRVKNNPNEKEKNILELMKNELSLVDDWLDHADDGIWQTLPEKPTYAVLMRRQEAWHQDVLAREEAGEVLNGQKKKATPSWESPLPGYTDRNWTAVELNTGSALSEEGKAMHHCVSSYTSTCKTGNSRIYSVRLNQERYCTVEFKLKGADGKDKVYQHAFAKPEDHWVLYQNKGKCNAMIKDKNALDFCKSLMAGLNAAHQQRCEILFKQRSEAAKERAKKNIIDIQVAGLECLTTSPTSEEPNESPLKKRGAKQKG